MNEDNYCTCIGDEVKDELPDDESLCPFCGKEFLEYNN